MENKQTIVAFHIGRGGRFYNSGHLSFLGENNIGKFVNDLFVNFEKQHELFNLIKGRPNLENKYYDCSDNENFSWFKRRIGFDVGEMIYSDSNGNPVGLTCEEEETGVGTINLDNDYDTTYCKYIEDCDENELQLIHNHDYYVDSDILNYVREALNIEEDSKEEENEE